MRGALRELKPLRSIRMREGAYNLSVHFRMGRVHRIVLTIVYTVTQSGENKKTQTVYHPQGKCQACGPISSKSA
jgi:hypothetical protein